MNRFNRYLAAGEKPGETSDDKQNSRGNGKAQGKGKEKGKAEASWIDTLREGQTGYGQAKTGEQKHRFEVSQTRIIEIVADNRPTWSLLRLLPRPLSCTRNTKYRYIMINQKK